MIILDFQQIMLSNLHAQVGMHTVDNQEVDPEFLRHMILNTVRSIRTKYKKDYGEIVIACENRSWRRDVYPYYKANRAKARDESKLNWTKIFEMFAQVRDDIKEYFPYRVIHVPQAEADDIIGTLVANHGDDMPMAIGEQILIVSGDHDFSQLHKYNNVKQYDTVFKKWVQPKNKAKQVISATEFLLEHIITGDTGDGVPNILSDDDTLVAADKRQPPMTKKRMAEFKERFAGIEFVSNPTEPVDIKFNRNKQLIDLRCTPDNIRNAIIVEFDSQAGKDRKHLFNYFATHKLKMLMDSIGDF